MADKFNHQDAQDFTNLTDSIIPSNSYMSNWNHPSLTPRPDNQSFQQGFNVFSPGLGSMVATTSLGSPPPLLGQNFSNSLAFQANSLQHPSYNIGREQEERVGDSYLSRMQLTCSQDAPSNPMLPQDTLQSPSSLNSESKVRIPQSNKDPLVALKMRAKESILAKRGNGVSSPSHDSKNGSTEPLANKPPQSNGTPHEPGNSVFTAQMTKREADDLITEPFQPLSVGSKVPNKATSVELDDLLAEGRAAASLGQPVPEHSQNTLSLPQAHAEADIFVKDVSEAGEVREENTSKQAVTINHLTNLKLDHVSAAEIEEIDYWLTMTGYYDKAYRDKVLSRRRRLKEIEEERLKLLQEEQYDNPFRGPFQGSVQPGSSQAQPTTNTTHEISTTPAKQELGMRIKSMGIRPEFSPPSIVPQSQEISLKRRPEDDGMEIDRTHASKSARMEPINRSGTISHHRDNRSISPQRNVSEPQFQSRPALPKNMLEHPAPGKDTDQRGGASRREGLPSQRDYRVSHHRRQDSNSDMSIAPIPTSPSREKTRFFMLKSWNYENIETARQECTWATQTKNEEVFVEAFRKCKNVIFFFSANHSKAFQGYARMQTLPGEKGVREPSWVKRLHWPTTEPFRIRWIQKGDTPYRAVGNMKNPLNEGLAVFVGRDGQEIPEELGHQLCDIIDEDLEYRRPGFNKR